MDCLMYNNGRSDTLFVQGFPPVGPEPMGVMSKLTNEKIRFGIFSGYLACLAAGSFLNNTPYEHIEKLNHDKVGDIDLWVHYDDFDDAVKITDAEVETVKHKSLTVDNYQLRFQVEKALVKAGSYEIEFCRQKTPIFACQDKKMFEYPWKVGDSMAAQFRTYQTESGPITLSNPYDSLLFYLILGRPKDESKIRLLMRSNVFAPGISEYFQARNEELGISSDDRVSSQYAEILLSEYKAVARTLLAREAIFEANLNY